MKPIIGITASTDGDKLKLNYTYYQAVAASGAVPLVLPYVPEAAEEMLEAVDGILLSGGGDIDAKYFNEKLHEKANYIHTDRDEFEIALCRLAVERDLPVFGICRGMQVLNVALGGNLCQHIEGHSQKEARPVATHDVIIECDTPLFGILQNDKIRVNSFHHQSVGRVADGLQSCAKSDDGIVEAVYHKNKSFVLGVQWHPEEMAESDLLQRRIFSAFIEACR